MSDRPEWLIIGLGNPGLEYRSTRHNIGFMAIDILAEKEQVEVEQTFHEALTGMLHLKEGDLEYRILLCKPQSYMNNSGEPVAALMDKYSIPAENIMVILDDFQLPLGQLRLRAGGSDGGHNGLKSINECLELQDYPRLRLGIGSEELNGGRVSAVDFVLNDFAEEEEDSVKLIVNQAAELVVDWVKNSLEYCQNKYN
ncbi:MAG: aminoacyl-tRNA hydrolase [Planctomycetota bacterium]